MRSRPGSNMARIVARFSGNTTCRYRGHRPVAQAQQDRRANSKKTPLRGLLSAVYHTDFLETREGTAIGRRLLAIERLVAEFVRKFRNFGYLSHFLMNITALHAWVPRTDDTRAQSRLEYGDPSGRMATHPTYSGITDERAGNRSRARKSPPVSRHRRPLVARQRRDAPGLKCAL